MYLLKGYHPSDSFFLRVNDVTFECYFCGVLGMRLERLYTSVGPLVFLPSVEELVSCAPASLAQRRSREFLCHNLLNSLTHFSFKYFLTFHFSIYNILPTRYYCMYLCMCLGTCFLHSASSLTVTTSPHVKQFTQRPLPGETLRALMEEMPMSE